MSAIVKVQRMFWYHRKLLKHLVEGEQQPVHQVNGIFIISVCWLMKASKIAIKTVNKFYMTNQNNMDIKREIWRQFLSLSSGNGVLNDIKQIKLVIWSNRTSLTSH